MNEMVKMVVVLTVLSSISGGVLAGLRDGTAARIERQELEYVKGPAIRQILNEASNDPVEDRFKLTVNEKPMGFYVGEYDGEPKVVCFETTGKGYGDVFGLMVAVDTAADQMVGIGVTTHKETPGLGAQAKDDPSFAAQFKGLPIDKPFKVTTDGGSINALSGATITSRAVCDAATEAMNLYRDIKPQLTAQMASFAK